MSALLLVAHGATDRPLDAHPLHQHAAALRAQGGWSQVEVGFLRGAPSIADALARLTAPAVVVPCFMARGYFVEQVLPAALGHPTLTIGATTPDGLLTLAPPAGEQPELAEVALAAVDEALQGRDASTWRVILVGHGTTRHAQSGATVEAVASALRDARGLNVQVGYLDQEPAIEPIMISSPAPTLILPWLAGGGGHAEQDIPQRATALATGPTITLPPIGAHPAMIRAIARAARVDAAG